MKVLFSLPLFVVYLQELEGGAYGKENRGWRENCVTRYLEDGVQSKGQWWIGSSQHENSKSSYAS
jgi:hypothetical protein